MKQKEIISLLEKKRDEIINAIKMATVESFKPDFYGIYEIYLNREDDQFYVLPVDRDKTYFEEDSPMLYLYDIPSHAIKEGDFKQWLAEGGIKVSKKHNEKKTKQLYNDLYIEFLNDILMNTCNEVLNAEYAFDEICELYRNNKKVTLKNIVAIRG